MPRNDDGEFELILGNKQLLSVFFIMVILLGVFFTMGYIVGRNSTPVTGPATASVAPGETKPLVVESPVPRAPESPPPTTPPSSTAPQLPPSESPAPVKETVKPAPEKSE